MLKHLSHGMLLGLLSISPLYANPGMVEGVEIPSVVQGAEKKFQLVLNGKAVQPLYGKRGYVAALYLQQQNRNPNLILLTDAPAEMTFHFLQDDLTPEMLYQLFSEGIMVNNPELDKSSNDVERVKAFLDLFKKNLNAGDQLIVQYTPTDQSVIVLINHNEIMRWKHAKTFFNRLLKMWLGEHPPSRTFKEQMLGG